MNPWMLRIVPVLAAPERLLQHIMQELHAGIKNGWRTPATKRRCLRREPWTSSMS
jgi:hypothetical protein